jgi:hypothetical protein
MTTANKVQAGYARTFKSGGLARTTDKLARLGMKTIK